jgi:ferrochelatase
VKLAVVLFNLGGPDSLEAVRPFLFNLFKDRAIIDLPAVARLPLAAFISRGRDKVARANYELMGGASPLLKETRAQALMLGAELRERAPDVESKVFIAMRYWKPFTADTAAEVAAFAPDEIVLLPLYPQYSTTTTASSLAEWRRAYKGPGRSRTVCCYPTARGLALAHARLIREAWDAAGRPGNVRLLFSAHGLPERVVTAGDPYEAQIAAAAQAAAVLLPELDDWQVCYQSRVGRLKWLEPSTENAIREAAKDGKGVIVAPIAFVSEHVETLVELDHEYAALARTLGVAPYIRARTPGVTPTFIETLARAALEALPRQGVKSFGPWLCPAAHAKCAMRAEG